MTTTRAHATSRRFLAALTAFIALIVVAMFPQAATAEETSVGNWSTCHLPLSETHGLHAFAGAADLDDPLHWHFSRVENLTARPLGKLRARGATGGPLPDFNNFSDGLLDTREYVDAAGVTWILQPPAKSKFHQPDTSDWSGWPFVEPQSPDQYPMRKFMTRDDNKGRSFELVLQPDDLTVQPFTYDQQKVLTGPFGGTFNYGAVLVHWWDDVKTHEHEWRGLNGELRNGGTYDRIVDANVIYPKRWESAADFRKRARAIVDNLDQIRGAALRGRHNIQVRQSANGLQYRLTPKYNGATINVSPELRHVVADYLAYKDVDLRVCAKALQLNGTWKGTYTCSQGLSGMTLTVHADPNGDIEAMIDFYALPGKSKPEIGAHTFRGELSPRTDLHLRKGRWISRPPYYRRVDLKTDLKGLFGRRLSGDVVGISGGCTTFNISKINDGPKVIPS